MASSSHHFISLITYAKVQKKSEKCKFFAIIFLQNLIFFARYSVTALQPRFSHKYPQKLYIYIYKYRFFLGMKWQNFHCNAVTV